MMFLRKLYLPLSLIAFSFLMIQCTATSDEVVPTKDVQNLDLLGLDEVYTTTAVAKFTHGVPTTSLKLEQYEAMYQRVAETAHQLDGSLVNYYVEAKENTEGINHYFLILSGELSDGTFMKTGFQLTDTDGGMTIDRVARPRPVPHFSCRSSVCSNCVYRYDLNGRIDCFCDVGPDTCVRYYPDEDPT